MAKALLLSIQSAKQWKDILSSHSLRKVVPAFPSSLHTPCHFQQFSSDLLWQST